MGPATTKSDSKYHKKESVDKSTRLQQSQGQTTKSETKSEMSSLCELLLNHGEILDELLYNWLDVPDVVNLDSAMVKGAARELLLTQLSQARYNMPYKSNPGKWSTHGTKAMDWLAKREMYHCEGQWILSAKEWAALASAEKYDSMLAAVRSLKVKVPKSTESLQQLFAKCTNLSSLELFALPAMENNLNIATLNTLESVVLHRCMLQPWLVDYLCSCPKLTKVHLKGANFSKLPAGGLSPLLMKIDSLIVEGDCSVFLKEVYMCETHISHLVIDNINTVGTDPLDVSQILMFTPHLLSLTISRARVNAPSLFKCLSSFNHQAQHLNLVHITSTEKIHNCPDVPVSTNITHFHIASPQPGVFTPLNDFFRFVAPTVTHLRISFCIKFKPEDFSTLIGDMPHLQSLEINAREAILLGTRKGNFKLATLIEACAAAHSLSIVSWPQWVLMNDSETLSTAGRHVAFER